MREEIGQQENAIFRACLAQTRTKADLTQQQLSELMGVSEAMVSAWEEGSRHMDFAELRQFCKAVGITLSDFIDQLELVLSQWMDTQEQGWTEAKDIKS